MATRQDRLLERMRGARMHEVEDVSFGFELPAPESMGVEAEPDAEPSPPPAAPSVTRPPPNTSAKRTRPGPSPASVATARTTRSAAAASPPQTGPPARSRGPAIYDVSDQSSVDGKRSQRSSGSRMARRGGPSALSSALKRVSLEVPIEEDEEMEETGLAVAPSPMDIEPSSGSLPRRTSQLSLGSAKSPLAGRASGMVEEIGESPADAPGSGRRRPMRISAGAPVMGSSTLLQRVLEDLDETTAHVPSSSPLQRVVRRRSGETASVAVGRQQRRSARLSAGSSVGGSDGVDETTPRSSGSVGPKESTPRSSGRKRARAEPTVPPVEEEPEEEGEVEGVLVDDEAEDTDPEDEAEEAQEIGDKEAAQRLAKRKRTRRSLPAPPSPDHRAAPEPEPAAKRRRRKEAASPAQQQQPKAPKTKPAKKPAARKKRGPKAAEAADDDEADGGAVPVTVHRFTKKAVAGEDEPDADILNAEIPYANRGGVNAVDVLSKLCEELIGAFAARLEENVQNAEDTAGRREQRTMLRSLEAFQEELRTRLLEHTIALDTLHALRKRVRVAQKEKLSLRDEILRVRAERNQVALRMDAIRIKHEAESKEALRHISLSSAMHDIDLVVEKGQAAEELSSAEQKQADLANLELLVNRMADQVGCKRDCGGALRQIKEFNAFLERTAGVLEGR
ncbi:hypothetical protein QBC34DRAFT_409623 [Podospora aff. communis PSN243]|uniref:Inner kinetochore subunit AME1 domain-containing protein n=1 Tax=Podospora aff. communis PSN243 TaxID=3040156 RepID=A0AAV9GJD7_9PEZI|nr:hypothetical protein QBC34DRAFT_409623 [Podospora aff. communis PSN243]